MTPRALHGTSFFLVHDFCKLRVWIAACELGTDIYRLCGAVTRPEAKAITSQLRRSALSISANIAEGSGKNSRSEMLRYLQIAAGSAAETERHLLVAEELFLIPATRCRVLAQRVRAVRKMLRGLSDRLPEDARQE